MVLLLAGLLFLSAGKSFVLAQSDNEPTGFNNLQLFLYPEYDDPWLLVMLQGQIEGVDAPAKVRFLVPEAARMYAAGSLDDQGVYSGGPPDRQPSEIAGWDEISYEVTSNIFRMEYYDPIISGNPEKSISYDFRWLYPISGMNVIIQQPRTALDLTIIPAGGQGFLDEEGLNSYLYTYTDLDEESSPLHFDITYYKPDELLSVESDDDTSNTGTTIAAISSTILVLTVLVFIWFRIRSRPRSRADRRRTNPTSPPLSPGGKAESRYCSQCGKSINSSYKFCPDCGAKLP